jgi:hypothetical protein
MSEAQIHSALSDLEPVPTPLEPMPWPVATRLRCLRMACDMAMAKGVRNPTELAAGFLEWVLGPEHRQLAGPGQRPAPPPTVDGRSQASRN